MIIKAITIEKQHYLKVKVDNYYYLQSLQGQYILVCLRSFMSYIIYQYYSELIVQIMVLSWSRICLQYIINKWNSSFFHQKHKKVLAILQLYKVIYSDSEQYNILQDDPSSYLVIVDLEDIKWLKRPQVLKPISSNIYYGYYINIRTQVKIPDQLNYYLHMVPLGLQLGLTS